MKHRSNRRVLALAVVLAGVAAVAPAAQAAVSPTISLDQSAGTKAGSTQNVGLDLKFANTGTDSPRDLTINLPPGLLADASLDGGSCLKAANVSGTTCQVGSGTVTATADPIPGVLNLPLPVSVPVTFYLVPPPNAGDLAGLAVEGLGEQIGSTGEIKLRPTGDPSGVGLSIDLILPDQLPLTLPIVGKINTAQISLTEIQSTFDGLRYPATCPTTPARLGVSVDSYSDATVHTVSAPLTVTGCSSLSYSPNFGLQAVRDSNDRQVSLATEVTQAPGESPSRSLSLAFPSSTLAPNLQSIQALCLDPASGTCSPVGSVSATSPLYPAALRGNAYLTGSPTGLSLTLLFPAPFPLTLAGAVDLVKNSATFTGLPDIPLTDLQVSLDGGPAGLFLSTCRDSTGIATAILTDQNGDKTVNAGSSFTVSGCPGVRTGGTPAASSASGVTVGTTTLSKGGFSGLSTSHSALRFKLHVAKHPAKIRALTVALPKGLRFPSRVRANPSGVTLTGAKIKSLSLSHGRLTIVLRRAVSGLTVAIHGILLTGNRTLASRTERAHTLPLTVTTENTRGQRTVMRVEVSSRRSTAELSR
jgi:hypothetical protein